MKGFNEFLKDYKQGKNYCDDYRLYNWFKKFGYIHYSFVESIESIGQVYEVSAGWMQDDKYISRFDSTIINFLEEAYNVECEAIKHNYGQKSFSHHVFSYVKNLWS